jgi:hypothetical protein
MRNLAHPRAERDTVLMAPLFSGLTLLLTFVVARPAR